MHILLLEEEVESQELSDNSDFNNNETDLETKRNTVDNDKINAQEAILCCGAWSNQLFNEIPVSPVKGQMFSIQGPKGALKRIIFGPGIYLVPREDGLIVVGATSEQNAGFDDGLTPHGQSQLQAGLNSLLPTAMSWPHMERWWGFRPCSPDEGPILGKSSLQGLWLSLIHI